MASFNIKITINEKNSIYGIILSYVIAKLVYINYMIFKDIFKAVKTQLRID